MGHLFSKAIFLAMLISHNQKLPDTFYKIPEPLRETATIIVSGTYAQGRTPCMLRPDGTRVWALDSWFTIKRVYRGEVRSKSIHINTAMLPKTEYINQKFKPAQEYLVLLRPVEETLKKLKTAEGVSFWEALQNEEIIAIMELK
jgi:hypothetical protein